MRLTITAMAIVASTTAAKADLIAANYAEMMQRANQAEMPMSGLIEALDDSARRQNDPHSFQVGMMIIESAYRKQRYVSESIREQAVADFREAVQVTCLETAYWTRGVSK